MNSSKIFILFALAFISLSVNAQNNLQFNAAKYITITGTPSSNNQGVLIATTPITVPAGKVWKIESAGTSYVLSSPTLYTVSACPSLMLDFSFIYISTSPNSAVDANCAAMPIWLPAGSYNLRLVAMGSGTSGSTANGYISGIEFNLVP